MPFDLDRIIDHQLYLATQQCIQPHVQQRRVSSAPVPSAAAAAAAAAAAGVGPARAAGVRKSSLGSLVSPWSPFSGGSSSGGSSGNPRYPAAFSYRPRRPQGSSPVDLFFTAPVGIPLRGGRGDYGRGIENPAYLARDDSSSSLDHFVTASVGDFSIGADVGDAPELLPPLQPRNANGSRPGSSDTDDWTFATASGGSIAGTCSGLDTTVDLTPSPPPSSSLQTGKRVATHMIASAPKPSKQRDHSAGPASARVPASTGTSVITLPVQDLQRTKRFYEHVFGTPCLYSSRDGKSVALRLNNGALVVTLHESQEKWCRAGQRVLLSVPVDNVEEVYRRLQCLAEEAKGEDGKEGVAIPMFLELVSGPEGSPVVMFSDPAGNRWQVARKSRARDGTRACVLAGVWGGGG